MRAHYPCPWRGSLSSLFIRSIGAGTEGRLCVPVMCGVSSERAYSRSAARKRRVPAVLKHE